MTMSRHGPLSNTKRVAGQTAAMELVATLMTHRGGALCNGKRKWGRCLHNTAKGDANNDNVKTWTSQQHQESGRANGSNGVGGNINDS